MRFPRFKMYLNQLETLTVSNLKSRYRGTWTGFFWVLLNPIIMYGAQSYAFNLVLKVDIRSYGLFLISGLLPWLFLNQSIDMGVTTLTNHGRLLKSFPVHPLVLIGALVVENFIHFILAFFLLIVPAFLIYKISFSYLLLTPFAFLILLVGVTTLSSLAALMNVFFRDIKFVLQFLLAISFFLTPIFYDIQFVPENLKWLIDVNIFYHLISPFRELLHKQDLVSYFQSLWKALALALGLVGLTFFYWTRKQNQIYARL